jgi:hypothetical protein
MTKSLNLELLDRHQTPDFAWNYIFSVVMITRLQKPDIVLFQPIDQAMLIRNPPRPSISTDVFQWFRFTNSFKMDHASPLPPNPKSAEQLYDRTPPKTANLPETSPRKLTDDRDSPPNSLI